jgi:hypothetical protein
MRNASHLTIAAWTVAALCALPAARAMASGGGGAPAEGHGKPEETAAPVRTDVLSLDEFRIRTTRTNDGEIIDIRLGLWLVLSNTTSEHDFHALEEWKNRLRDQVIIAVRSVELEDFADPELRRLQRLTLFRVKRLPIGDKLIGVYLTDFELDEGESLADAMAPAIIPSAAPAKKPAGGGH